MGLLVDVTPLRVSRDFRRLWIGQAVSFVGSMITSATLPYQVYRHTGSSAAVGLLGIVQLVPLLGFSIVGGVYADAIDKRRMLLLVTLGSAGCSALLWLNASLAHPQLWVMYVLGAVSMVGFSLTFPVVRSLMPMLVEPHMRPAAFALYATYGSFGMMVGPAAAGAVIAWWGITSAYGIDVVTYLVALAVFAGLAPAPPVLGEEAERGPLLEGIRHLRGSLVTAVFGIDLCAMVFGMPRALFPALSERLGGGPGLYGLLLASVAAGAFVASLASGWTTAVRRQGRAVILSVALWGAAIALAGATTVTALVLVLLAVAGAADMVSGVYRSTIASDLTPDELRGRVSGVELAVYAGGPVLGDAEAGLVGGVAGVPFAIVSGGLACIAAAAAFARWVPALDRYEVAADVERMAP